MNKNYKRSFIDFGLVSTKKLIIAFSISLLVTNMSLNFSMIYSSISGLKKERDEYFMYYRLNEIWHYENQNKKSIDNMYNIMSAIKDPESKGVY